MKCVRCEERKATHKKRGLCAFCYGQVYHKNQLSDYPKIHNHFRNRLIKKYGEELITDFERSAKDVEFSLTKIAKKYNFTVPHAQQTAEQLFGKGQYIKLRKERRRIINIQNRIKIKHPHFKAKKETTLNTSCEKGNLTEKIVWDKLVSLDLAPTYPLYRNPFDLMVGDKKIEIKGAHTAVKTTEYFASYYIANITKAELQNADYLIIYIHPEKEYYCIPIEKIKSTIICIPNPKSEIPSSTRGRKRGASKWQKYKEAWHLLKE